MPSRRSLYLAVFPVAGLLILTNCARRPTPTEVAAPAPSVAVGSIPAPPSAGVIPPALPPEPPRVAAAPPPPAPRVAAAPATAMAPRPATVDFARTEALRTIHFDFDRYDIRPDDARVLDANASWLRANPDYLVLIEGHCDERGTEDYNLALGERRARAALNYLVRQGVAAARITALSYGEERPVCLQRGEACWSENRRADFLVRRR